MRQEGPAAAAAAGVAGAHRGPEGPPPRRGRLPDFTVPTKNSDGKTPADVVDRRGPRAHRRARRPCRASSLSGRRTSGSRPRVVRRRRRSLRLRRQRADKERGRAARRPRPRRPTAGDCRPRPRRRPRRHDPRPKQGDPVTFVEKMTPALAAHAATCRAIGKPIAATQAGRRTLTTHPLPVMAQEVKRLHRIHVAAGRSKKGNLGPMSARIAVPFADVPPVPPQPTVHLHRTRRSR